MSTRTMTPGAISYVVRRAQTVLRQVDNHQALYGTALGTPPLDAAVRHSGTDVVSGAVGAYSIRHGDADANSERQVADSKRKTLPVPGGHQGDVRSGTLAHLPTYLPRHTYVRHLPPMVARPGAFYGEWTATKRRGGAAGVHRGNEAPLTKAQRDQRSNDRAKVRVEQPELTTEQVERVVEAISEAREARQAEAGKRIRLSADDRLSIATEALAVSGDRGW